MTAAALREAAARWWRDGRDAIVVTVVAHRGSVPRDSGTRMVVAADAVLGTIGGGHLEFETLAQARRWLAQRAASPPVAAADDGAPRRLSFALGPSLGQCCGGTVELALQPLATAPPAAWPAEAVRFHLQLHGGGHVGRALARLLATLPCQVDWIDERDDAFDDGAPDAAPLPAVPSIRRLVTDAAEAEVAAAAPGTFFLVLTHSHALDLQLTQAILARGDFGFFGLIGSRSKRMRFEHRLRERGIDDAVLARMVCPIGLPGIDGKEPEVIAVAAVAQLLQAAGAGRRDAAGRLPAPGP